MNNKNKNKKHGNFRLEKFGCTIEIIWLVRILHVAKCTLLLIYRFIHNMYEYKSKKGEKKQRYNCHFAFVCNLITKC